MQQNQRNQQQLSVVDMHTSGEPVRIVVGGYPALQGATILEKRRDALQNHDHLRRALMLEPRGHDGMYGAILTPSAYPEAVTGVLFMHNEGYSTMCGHATIALGRYLVDKGFVAAEGPIARFAIEAPCGLVRLAVERDSGKVSFESVPSFAHARDLVVDVPGFGAVTLDIAYGGAFYAILPSSKLGLDFFKTPVPDLVAAGCALTDHIRATRAISHPSEPDLGFLYGTILTDDAAPGEESFNLCIFAEGQIDRSPTGSGVTARMALDHAKGLIAPGVSRRFRSVTGDAFEAKIVGPAAGIADAVTVEVSGKGYYAGEAQFVIEADDPFGGGFELPKTIGALRR